MTKLLHGRALARVGATSALAAILALLATMALPAVIEAQGGDLPPPPSLFVGSTDDITVHGDAYDGTTAIEVLDGDGNVLGTADVAEGTWVYQADVDASDTISFRVGDAVSDPFAVVAGQFSSDVVLTLPGEGPSLVIRDVPLSAGFQALTHVGGLLSVDDFLLLFENPDAVDAVFVWDALAQGWISWRAALPAPFQGVTEILPNMPLLLLLNAATTYTSEILPYDAGAATLVVGFTGLAFLGGDAVAIGDVMAAITNTGAVTAIFRFNNGTGLWDTFNAVLPPALNSLQTVVRWDFLLANASVGASWSHDAFQP